MIKIRNCILYIVVCIIIFTSFKLPETLLDIENDYIAEEIFNDSKNASTMDVNTEKIYLVNAIHKMEEGKTIKISNPQSQYVIVEKSINKPLSNNIDEQIESLKKYNIIKDIDLDQNGKDITIGLINKCYKNNNETYIVNHVILNYDNSQYLLNIEDKTGKAIYIAIDKEKIFDRENKKQILENYIKYLNLYIIDDWKYEEDEPNKFYNMKSQKAQLTVSLSESSDNFMFSIHIINNFKVIDTN